MSLLRVVLLWSLFFILATQITTSALNIPFYDGPRKSPKSWTSDKVPTKQTFQFSKYIAGEETADDGFDPLPTSEPTNGSVGYSRSSDAADDGFDPLPTSEPTNGSVGYSRSSDGDLSDQNPSQGSLDPPPKHESPSFPTQSSLCVTTGSSPTFFRMNVGGGAIPSAEAGAENEKYIHRKENTGISMSDSVTLMSASTRTPWDEAYKTYRWTEGIVLRYRIPVAEGTFTVKLLFAESMHRSANSRLFDVYINGVEKESALDVYAAVGRDTGLMKEYSDIRAAAFIEVALVTVLDHPMISGIIIEGPGAGAKAVGGGCDSVEEEEMNLNNGFDHRAHAVPNGPYDETDFDKIGSAMVSLDGTLSHSHYSDPGPPEILGHIVSYKWTWTEIVNGTEVRKENRDDSGKFQSRFPMGRTLVTLEVVDNTGDTSSDYAEVDVRPSTKPGAYCYGYDLGNASMSSVPNAAILEGLLDQRPIHGGSSNQISFRTVDMFGTGEVFEKSFMYRCSFFLQENGMSERNISLLHHGPFLMYQSGAVVAASEASEETNLDLSVTGLQDCEILYFRNVAEEPLLELLADGIPLPASELSHDRSTVIPVISSLSESASKGSGGGSIRIFGTGFYSDVRVFFGDTEASNKLRISSKLIQVTVPRGENGEVQVVVKTKVAVSNAVKFVYGDPADRFRQPIIFGTKHLQHPRQQKKQNFPLVASIVYGPDFRLYLGTYRKGQIHAVSVGDAYKLLALCTHNIGEGRSALGLTFSPFTNRLRLYFSSSTVFWKKWMPFEEGWVNGKIESVDFSWRYRRSGEKAEGACSFNQQEVVTGLPVSAHDHSVNKLEFSRDGRLLITIGGFTNGGISVPGRKRVAGDPPDDRFGGVASNPFSAAIVSCPVHKVTRITYDQYTDPEKSRVQNGTDCFVYASGIRNSFGMTLHTNGHVYVTDNGGSRGNGEFALDCNGRSMKSTKQKDKLFRVQRGGYHGHPNLNRKECRHYPADAVQPILSGIESSTDGVMEYRSNVFGGRLKGDLVLTKFASNNRDGRVSQVRLSEDGGVVENGFIENLYKESGLTVVEGPRGELVMSQVYQNGILFVYPKITKPEVTFVVGVLPKRGPARGGARVLVSGFGFSQNSTVWFGDKECERVKVVDEQKLTCSTPAAGPGDLVSVVVEGIGGRSPSYGSDYWYF